MPTDPTIQWSAPVKSPSEVHAAWSDAVDVIAWWLNLFGEKAVNDRLHDEMQNSLVEANEAISWTRTGALMTVRVIRLEGQDTPLRTTAILGDKPQLLAMGDTPQDALFHYLSTDRLEAGVPQGWVADNGASYYVWVTQEYPKGQPLSRGTVRELTDQVKARFSEFAINKFTDTYRTGAVLSSIVQRAKQNIADQQVKENADRILNLVLDSQRRVLGIQEKLQRALDASSKASNTLMLLNTLKGVLTVAQLAGLAAAELNKPPATFRSDTTAEAVLNRTSGIKNDADASRIEFQTIFEGADADFRKYQEELRKFMDAEAPPPPIVLDYLRQGRKVP